MNMRKSGIIVLGIIMVSFISGIYFYLQMPEKMASHWNSQGEVNRYISKFWGLFLMPLISVGLFLLFITIPKIDPLKHNIENFRQYYDGFAVLMMVYLFYVYLITVLLNRDIKIDMIQLLIPASGILLYYIGVLIGNVEKNWFIGIRTRKFRKEVKSYENTCGGLFENREYAFCG